ncbi:MAG: EF-hand domain-containing protein [Parvibaculum sp.]|nr:EF-hand domain-containing protein [Parvibaculum sp.]
MRKLKFGLLGAASALALAIAIPALSHAETGKPGHGARMMFEQADTDKSGDISQAEMRAAAEMRFDAADADGDGIVTKAEFEAAKEQQREKF